MSRLFEELVERRGVGADFLRPCYEKCVAPNELPDMEKAVERLVQARERGEKVLIYGDYDVDGVTASTVMVEALELAGIEVAGVMLPNRFTDGYGMSKKCVQRAKELGATLVVTVDCGSRNEEVIRELAEVGVETIVTDHHECGEKLPEAVAVVNPKRRDVGVGSRGAKARGAKGVKVAKGVDGGGVKVGEGEGVEKSKVKVAEGRLRSLAGVGVAFKVAQALVEAGLIPAGQEKWLLDLVLIGTMCDSMPMTEENRRLCYYGMKVLEKTRRQGLKELLRVAGVQRLNGETIGFQIGPRLNAAGRMASADKALALVMAKRKTEAAKLAAELEDLNKARRNTQIKAVEEIRAKGVGEEPVVVVRGNWHEGVLGIIAGKLVEEYERPAFVLSEVSGVLKGSGRSFGEFSLAGALEACRGVIIGGGGHAEACGVRLEVGRFEEFRGAVNEFYRGLKLENQGRFLGVHEDLAVEDFGELSLEFLEELALLEPFGMGNEEPVFLLPEARVIDVAKMGAEQNHLRLQVWDKNQKSLKLIKFFAPEEYLRVRAGDVVNLWVTVRENEFRGIRSVEGEIKKMVIV